MTGDLNVPEIIRFATAVSLVGQNLPNLNEKVCNHD